MKIKRVLSLLLVVISIFSLCFSGCGTKSKTVYAPKPYTNKDLLVLFEKHRPLFDETVRIINQNTQFWRDARTDKNDPYDLHPWISSPDDLDRMNLFTEEEQKTLQTFFAETKPYMITLDLEDSADAEKENSSVLKRSKSLYLRIDYTNEDYTDSYEFIYCYSSETAELQNKRQWGYTIVDLENNWYFCYR